MKTSFAALDCALTALAVSSLGSQFVLNWAYHKKRQARAAARPYQPGISVLKPLCGVDEGLYDNLVSFAEQRYPNFELVFGVADPRDPALALVQRLREAYPDAPIKLVVHGEDDPAANPKVISLQHMARAALHDYVLISDSNVRVTPDYLSAIIAEMADPRVGLVSSLIIGAGEASLGAQCENLHLNTFVIGGVCIADLADKPCVVGKSMLMRKGQLDALGGFDSLRRVLAEDYLLGQRYHEAGYRVVLSRHPVTTHNQQLTMRRFLARHLRWAQLRRRCALGTFFSEPLLYASPFILAPLALGEPEIWTLPCMAALCVRIGNDALLARSASGRWPALSALALLPIKDTLLLGAWAVAAVRSSVAWRGHTLRIGAGTRVLPLPPPRFQALRQRAAAVFH
jgi:ceramide glucosyltransferase